MNISKPFRLYFVSICPYPFQAGFSFELAATRVESYMAAYSDTGVWGVYFGCDPKNIARCRKLVLKEIDKFTSTPISAARLAAAKRQIKGQLHISRNSFNSYAAGMGRSFAKYNRHRDIEAQCRAIDALTAEEIMQAAKRILLPDNLTTLIYK